MTAPVPTRRRLGDASPSPGDRPGTTGRSTVGDAQLVSAVLVAIIVLQRLALPFAGGQVPFVLPFVVTVVAWAVHRRVLVADPLRRQLFLLALLGCAAATTIASWRGLPWSPLSILYLAATYVPFMFCLRRSSAEQYHAGLSLFLKLMTVAAVIGIAQVGLQVLGVAYADPFAVLPARLVMQGYHTSYPVVYGSSIFKANGIFFLEPSFYSQFLALALVIHFYLRRRGLGGYLLMGGIIASVSGTGIMLAVVGLVALGVTSQRRQLLRMAAAVTVVGGLVAISPLGSVFTSRIDESSSSTSSAQGRFIVPYASATSTLSADPVSLLTGRGPGAAERISEQKEADLGVTAVFPVMPKLAVEYGVPALVIFLAFILASTLWKVRSVALALPVLLMYFVLSGSLLQPVTVYTVYAVTSLFGNDVRRSIGAPRSRSALATGAPPL